MVVIQCRYLPRIFSSRGRAGERSRQVSRRNRLRQETNALSICVRSNAPNELFLSLLKLRAKKRFGAPKTRWRNWPRWHARRAQRWLALVCSG